MYVLKNELKVNYGPRSSHKSDWGRFLLQNAPEQRSIWNVGKSTWKNKKEYLYSDKES